MLHKWRKNIGKSNDIVNVEMILDGYSARVIREWYTHIAGGPTRLQSSTRYISYNDFDYVVPKTIRKNEAASAPVYPGLLGISGAFLRFDKCPCTGIRRMAMDHGPSVRPQMRAYGILSGEEKLREI